ncbi:MAG: alpha/beta hydrolase [Desulfosarcinaceae bacterium]|nr:alpha/beta hydrolase [Desulfosarcinaceae bacterium]
MTRSGFTADINGYHPSEDRQQALDGTPLFYRRFIPYGDRPTGRLDVIHGWADHSGRYTRLLDALRPLNLEICLPDLRGHGRSGGKRGHLKRFDDYLEDLDQVLGLSAGASDNPAPRWLLGHSMGGLVAFHLALRFPHRYQGLILSAPFMAPLPALSGIQKRLIRLASTLVPGLPFGKRLDPRGISHDPAVVQAYADDPLVHRAITPRWLAEILCAQDASLGAAARLALPILLQVSPDDTVVDPHAALAVYLRLPAGGKTLRVYPDRGHELYNETPAKRSKPLDDLVAWIGMRQEICLLGGATR